MTKRKKNIISLIILAAAGTLLHPYEIFDGQIYAQGEGQNQVIYRYTSSMAEQGDEISFAHNYTDPDGDIFAREILTLKNGEFLQHETQFPQLGERSLLIPSGDRMEIFFSREGKEKSKVIKVPDDLIFGPSQQDFIIENLDRFKDREKLSFSLPVPEFLTTMRFTMKLVEDSPYEQNGSIVLEMKSTNILLWFIAKPIQYVLDETTGIIQEIHGPTILKRKVGDKWEFFDSDIYFQYN